MGLGAILNFSKSYRMQRRFEQASLIIRNILDSGFADNGIPNILRVVTAFKGTKTRLTGDHETLFILKSLAKVESLTGRSLYLRIPNITVENFMERLSRRPQRTMLLQLWIPANGDSATSGSRESDEQQSPEPPKKLEE